MIKKNLDVIIPIVVFTFVVSTYFWVPQYFPEIQSNIFYAITSPILTIIGLLLAYRVNEKSRSPKLKLRFDFFKFEKSLRIFAEVENAPGRETAKDTKALITIRKIENGREELLESSDLFQGNELKDDDEPLVPCRSVRVEEELIPWMVPEVTYQSYGVHRIPLKHIANIAPGQRNRAPLFDVLSDGEKYYLRVFSEYGTEKELIEEWYGIPPKYLERRYIRIIRCALRPGYYKFHITISADKAYPAEGVMEVDTLNGKLCFLKPNKKKYDLKDLLKS